MERCNHKRFHALSQGPFREHGDRTGSEPGAGLQLKLYSLMQGSKLILHGAQHVTGCSTNSTVREHAQFVSLKLQRVHFVPPAQRPQITVQTNVGISHPGQETAKCNNVYFLYRAHSSYKRNESTRTPSVPSILHL